MRYVFLAFATLLLATPETSARAGSLSTTTHGHKSAVFWYGRYAGFNQIGAYSVVLSSDGTVSLQGSRYLHLRHPHVIQSRATIERLLHLARDQHFFALPSSFGHQVPDVGALYLQVTDGAATHMVQALPGVETPEEVDESNRFSAVYSAIARLTPICLKRPGMPKAQCWKG